MAVLSLKRPNFSTYTLFDTQAISPNIRLLFRNPIVSWLKLVGERPTNETQPAFWMTSRNRRAGRPGDVDRNGRQVLPHRKKKKKKKKKLFFSYGEVVTTCLSLSFGYHVEHCWTMFCFLILYHQSYSIIFLHHLFTKSHLHRLQGQVLRCDGPLSRFQSRFSVGRSQHRHRTLQATPGPVPAGAQPDAAARGTFEFVAPGDFGWSWILIGEYLMFFVSLWYFGPKDAPSWATLCRGFISDILS